MSVTIIDIAKDSNTSKSTVSRYLNGMKVRSASAKAIEASIKRLDYHPNVNARRLVTQKTKTIGVVIEDISNVYYSEILSGIQAVASANGYTCTFYSRASDGVTETHYLSLFREGYVDGLIVGTFLKRTKKEVENLAKSTCPIVLIGDNCFNNNIHSIDVDNKQGTYNQIEHLVEQGHTQIGYLRGPEMMFGSGQRWQGFAEGMETYGLDTSMVVDTEWTVQGGYNAALSLLKSHPTITALVCSNDYCAYGALMASRELGYAVPADISILAFDDGPLAKYSHPGLTTIKQPFKKLGEIAAQQLLETIHNETTIKASVLLQSQLVIRDSSTAVTQFSTDRGGPNVDEEPK